jgi:hypothetical protein
MLTASSAARAFAPSAAAATSPNQPMFLNRMYVPPQSHQETGST